MSGYTPQERAEFMAVAKEVPTDKHTLFIKGFPASLHMDDIRDFFIEKGGKCSYVFHKEDHDNLFVALRFEDEDVAADIMDAYQDRDVLGYPIQITYFKDHRLVSRQLYNMKRGGMHSYGGPPRFMRGGFRGRFQGSFRGRGGGGRHFDDDRHHDDDHKPRRRRYSYTPSSEGSRSRSRSRSMYSDEDRSIRKKFPRRRSREMSGGYREKKRRRRSPSLNSEDLITSDRFQVSDTLRGTATKKLMRNMSEERESEEGRYSSAEEGEQVVVKRKKSKKSKQRYSSPPPEQNAPMVASSKKSSINIRPVHSLVLDEPSLKIEPGLNNSAASSSSKHQINEFLDPSHPSSNGDIITAKKNELVQTFKSQCETIAGVTRLFINKNPSLTGVLQELGASVLHDIAEQNLSSMDAILHGGN